MHSRRTFVTAGGTTLAVALAGCTGVFDSGSSATYTDWLADEHNNNESFLVRLWRPEAFAGLDAVDARDLNPVEFVTTALNVDAETVETAVVGGAVSVYLGSFDAGSVLDGTAADGIESVGSYGGYELYHGTVDAEFEYTDQVPLSFALKNGTLLLERLVTIDNADSSVLETAIDASTGDAARFVETSERFGRLDDLVAGEAFRWLEAIPEVGILAGIGYEFDGADATLTFATVHEEAPQAEAFGNTLDEGTIDFGLGLSDPAVEVDAETVTLSATHPVDRFDPASVQADILGPVLADLSAEPAQPTVVFDYNYDEDSETLTVTVAGGEQFTAGQVRFRGRGFDAVGASWAGVAGEEVTTESTVSPSDQVTLTGVQSTFELDLVWESSHGSDSVVIGTTTGPDA